MKKKDIIYFASAAVLLGLTTPSVLADEQNSPSVDAYGPTNVLLNNSTPTSSSPTDGPKEESPVTSQPEQPTPINDPQPSNPSKPDQEKPTDPVNENVNQKPSGNLVINTNEESSFTITVSELQGLSGFKEIQIPFWSHANGMKDIVWYTPTQQQDGSYSVTVKASDHENAYGTYEAQLFYVD